MIKDSEVWVVDGFTGETKHYNSKRDYYEDYLWDYKKINLPDDYSLEEAEELFEDCRESIENVCMVVDAVFFSKEDFEDYIHE